MIYIWIDTADAILGDTYAVGSIEKDDIHKLLDDWIWKHIFLWGCLYISRSQTAGG